MTSKTALPGALLTLFFSFTAPLPASDTTLETIPEVDEIFTDFDSAQTPGCALGVIRDGEFIYRRGYGMANLEYDIPISSQSVFRIGSISKQFTATAIALLAESGKISVDDKLSKYFPEFPDWADEMTLRHLVLHTSGIRDYLTLASLAGRGDDQDYFTDEWAIALLARQMETNFPPGSQYLYSNSGYLLLANLVQRVSGQNLQDYSEAHIFAPLGMKNSHFHDDHTHIVPLRADGYAPFEDSFRISMTTLDIVGDGSVYTTIDDLLLWDRNFYDNRLGKGGPALIGQITQEGKLSNGEAMGYAFGLRTETYRGLPMIRHRGAFAGYLAEMIRFPEQSFSVVVLCNRSDGGPTAKARQVADHYLADLLEPRPAAETDRQQIQLDEDQLQRYAGDFWEYSNAVAAETRVIGGKLWAVHSPARRNELVPVGDDRFEMTGLPNDVIVVYTMSETGILQVSRTIDGYRRDTFKPFVRRQASAAELAAYAGDYYSPELEIQYRLRMQDDSLVFDLDGEEPREMSPMFGETFEAPEWGAFEFIRGDDGRITSFKLQSGRVRNLLFTRQ
jgi:CubicO group peptidase (beta-lactamase class C family)